MHFTDPRESPWFALRSTSLIQLRRQHRLELRFTQQLPHGRQLFRAQVDLAAEDGLLIEQQLTPEDEELTPTMKLKRQLVNRKYHELIEDMYR